MVTGRTAYTRQLTARSGRPVTVDVIRPDPTTANIAALRTISVEWARDAERLRDGRLQRRAYFAATVLFKDAASKLMPPTSCCVLLAVERPSGAIVGVATYHNNGPSWFLEDMTLSPGCQKNELNTDPVRGIGNAMLKVIADDVANVSCTKIELITLDEEAATYWRRRGFHNTFEPLNLTCEEVRRLAVALDDDPATGDLPYAGSRAEYERAEIPAVLGGFLKR